MKNSVMLILVLAIVPFDVEANGAPRIFYSDLDGGPNTGGQNDQGAFVTIYGKGFGERRGSSTVSIGGGLTDNYPIWSDTKIAFQLGHAARSGDIVVNVPGAAPTNGIPFVVRAGKIYFVSLAGRDLGSGSFNSPWRTIARAKDSIRPGDIAYVMDGVTQTGLDAYNASLCIISSGKAGSPKALVAYPGARVTIGSALGPEFGVRTPTISGRPFSYWTLAGLTLRGGNVALQLTWLANWRVVANDISCPRGDGAAGCFEAAGSNDLKFLGNFVHEAGRAGSSKRYQSVYFTTDSNHLEVGWNTIANNHSCRGIQFHSSPNGANSGFNQYDLIVHDNTVHGQTCDGINFATIDPSKGPVQAYNNIVYSVGLGPDPADGLSNYACISSPGITNRGSPGSGAAEWFNNTLFDCGPRGGDISGAFNAGARSPSVRLRNNIVYLRPGESYLEQAGVASLMSGSNNLWFGAGDGPSGFASNVNADPDFMRLEGLDFHLNVTSPAIHAGLNTGIATDLDGAARPQALGYSLGVFEGFRAPH
jgi:hypothetical protein